MGLTDAAGVVVPELTRHGGQAAETAAESSLEDWIRSDVFSCLAAKAAVRRGLLRQRTFGPLADDRTTPELHREIEEFVTCHIRENENFATFVAVFEGPRDLSEELFEDVLWRQLSALHAYDSARYPWAPQADPDPASPSFAFSVAGHPFFVVGLHSRSSRVSRRFSRPALAFNSHQQFERLKQSGLYQGLQRRIRQREMRLQNSINPNLAEFGEASEARQYSGRHTGPEWTCPFRARSAHRQ